MSNDEIKFEHKAIGEALAHHRLAVPLHQREYSWENEHVTTLLEDFSQAIATEKRVYFLGTIVLTSGDGEIPEVQDGQQRLATTAILIAAIRDYLVRHGDAPTRIQQIETDYLMTTDIDTTEAVPKLRLNVDDALFFTRFILANPTSADRKIKPTKRSHELIQQAATIISKHLQTWLEPFAESARINRLLDWLKFVRKGAQIVLLKVPDDLNAFVMFETLNDRGLRASQADLVKNHLLKYAGDSIKGAQSRWASVIGVLESLSQDAEIIVTYIHHFIITKNGPTRERDVLNWVRNRVNSKNAALELLDEMADSVNDYAALFNSDHAKWNKYGTATRNYLSTINRDLRVLQIRPLMFSVARHFSVKEAQKAFRMFVFWSVRFLIVGGRGGLLDRNYAVAAQNVGTREIKTADALAGALRDIIPTDRLFEANFAEARVSQVHWARYYLRALERHRKGEAEPEWIPNDEQVINLEHILPENPGESWPDIDTETANAYWRRIGNMVILQAKKNSIIGNKPFAEKKKTLEDSAFVLTSEAAQCEHWGVDEIEERQRRLAKLAVKTWPIKA